MRKRTITLYTIIFCFALNACTNNSESSGNPEKQTKSGKAFTKAEILADYIQDQKKDCPPEMLKRIAHSKDSILAYMKQHPLLKNTPDLELQAENKAVMWIKYRGIVEDESMPKDSTGVIYAVPKECIRKDGTIDQDMLTIKRLKGELKVVDQLKGKFKITTTENNEPNF